MGTNNKETLEDELREIQISLAKPSKKIIGALFYYLNFLNPLGRNGKSHEAPEKRASTRKQKYNGITWVDIENPNRREINQLGEEYDFHPLYLEASLLKGQPPQIEKEEKYLFLLLHIPNYDSVENKVVTSQVAIFLGKNYLITVHEDYISGIRILFNACEENKEEREAYFKKSSGYLLYNVIDNLVKDLSGLIKTVSQELDEIEDIVFDIKVPAAYKIGQLRQKIVRLRRILGFFRKILEDLNLSIDDFTGENLLRYYENITKIIQKLWQEIEESRETVEIYKDADFTVSTEQTNKILSVLTIVFTLTIPATVLGTFFGMNILLPGGLEAGSWTFWGPYTTFMLITAGSALPALLMLLYFKYKNWF